MTRKKARRRALEKFGESCCLCGRTMGDRDQGLSVHHINGDESDDRMENLIPLCQSCHLKVHRRDDPPYRWLYRRLPGNKHGRK
jgi:5-methylcytosine-specific restriction endonuclease McrA